MNIQNRNKDLIEIFDSRWKANHNDAVKQAKINDKKFIDKMFNNKKVEDQSGSTKNYMQERLDRLNSNIDAVKRGQFGNNRNKFR